MNINWIRNLMPWRVRLWTHLFFVKHPGIYSESVQQKKRSLQYNTDVFQKHMDKMHAFNIEGKVLCELGPGDSMLHALQAYSLGCEKMWLLDIDDLAGKTKVITQSNIDAFQGKISNAKKIPKVEMGETWEHFLGKVNGVYLTDGLNSYYDVPDESVDYIFSQAVLEHIRLDIFEETVRQTYRMCKKGAYCSHSFDLRDHLGGGINHLRFSKTKWESNLYKQMPNYVNRLGLKQIKDIFEDTGFEIVSCEVEKFDKMPIKRNKLDKGFTGMTDEELMTKGAWILTRKN